MENNRNKFIEENEKKYKMIFENVNDAILLYGINKNGELGEFIEVNSVACRRLGYSKEELLNMTPMDIDSNLAKDKIKNAINELNSFKKCFFETIHVTRDGREIPTEISSHKFYISDRPVVLSIARDISARLEEKKKSEKLSAIANEAKTQFLANMSHEIRTPMNGILGMLQLMQMTKLNSEAEEYIQIARESAEALMNILDDIINYSKIESGKVYIQKVSFNLKKIIEESLELFTICAKDKNIELKLDYNSSIPKIVMGDPMKIKQILTNLVGNAMKFTHKGRVGVKVKIVKRYEEKIELKFMVEDTGIGIPKEKINSLFEKFNQLDNSCRRKYGGTGLGLSICEKLIELMGGYIWVESELDIGSKFYFTLTLDTDSYIVSP